jgi:hypothetical protein
MSKRKAGISINNSGSKQHKDDQLSPEQVFNRFSIALFDFEKSIDYAEEAAKHSPGELAHEALLFAAIVCYYRPFTPNEKKSNPLAASMLKLEDFSPLTSDQAELHQHCKDLRNQALAHSGYESNPTRLHSSGVIVSRPFALLSNAPEIPDLVALARKLADECHNKRADHVRNSAP